MNTALICARGGSKGLPGKNIRDLCGKPLITSAIETARCCPEIESILVSTDDENIAEVARRAGASVPFIRPGDLAQDTSAEWSVWQHALGFLKTNDMTPEKLVVLPPTAPLRRVEDVSAAIRFMDTGNYDGVISITESHRNPCFNMVTADQKGLLNIAIPAPKNLHRRQDAPQFFDITTAFYVMKPEFVNLGSSLFDGNIAGYKIPIETAVDIDTQLDFDFASFILSTQLENS